MIKTCNVLQTWVWTITLAGLMLAWGCNPAQNNQNAQAASHNKALQAAIDPIAHTALKKILIFGNSLTAGYGLEDRSQAFPALLQNKIDSAKLPYKIINAGLSGETTAGGKSRISWLLKNPVDIFVLELGANDGLRGIPVTDTRSNLQSIIDQVKSRYPQAKLLMTGMLVPPNMGPGYSAGFKQIFAELAGKNKMALVPFLLEGVAGKPSLNQADGIHPTATGAHIVAANVWKVLKPML